MDTSTWVPWVLVLALLLPVVALRLGSIALSRGAMVALLVPALVMAVAAARMSVDHARVSQDELDEAAASVASDTTSSWGPLNAYEVAHLIGDDLGREVYAQRSDPEVPDEQNASYTIEVSLTDYRDGDSDGPRACLLVSLETFAADAPDLRFADVEASSGPC